MKVLFLTAWYPTERDEMLGLFVQKHADALRRQGADVRVLYYESTGIRWLRDMWQGWRQLHKEWGLPDVVQMNVLDKNGILAMWLHRRYRIPYIIVEHWTGYLPSHFSFKGGWHGKYIKYVAQQAAALLPVSNTLCQAMQDCGIRNPNWEIINNVVDDFFYEEPLKQRIPKKKNIRLLHVSCFDNQAKNIPGLLRAVRQVANRRQDFELVLVGSGIDFKKDVECAGSLSFPSDTIHFTGELSPQEVCHWMQSSDIFVLFSYYETFSVVLAECLAVGLPIITSHVAGIAETLPTSCGIVVPVGDEQALTNAILYMLDHLQDYPKSIIRPYGEAYRYDTVGKHLVEIYHQVSR